MCVCGNVRFDAKACEAEDQLNANIFPRDNLGGPDGDQYIILHVVCSRGLGRDAHGFNFTNRYFDRFAQVYYK